MDFFVAPACHLLGQPDPWIKSFACLNPSVLGYIGQMCGEQSLPGLVTQLWLHRQDDGSGNARNGKLFCCGAGLPSLPSNFPGDTLTLAYLCHLLFTGRCWDDFKEILLPGPYSSNGLQMGPLRKEGFCSGFDPRCEGSEQLFVKDVSSFLLFWKVSLEPFVTQRLL